MTDGMIFNSKDASSGAFQGVRKVRGLQASIEQVAGKVSEQYPDPKDQAKVTLEDVAILEMTEGEAEPELTDGKFTLYISYAKPGKKPHKNSLWIKGFVASAEALGKTPPDFNGQYVTIVRKPIFLFHDDDTDKDVAPEGWVYEKDDAAVENMDDIVKGMLIGKNKSTALRDVMTNPRAKQHPKYRQAISDGTILEKLNLELVDGKYKAK